ncbi:hypothetical protein MAP00_002999 [Monascus purpureus]|nr:hypothetical protein MAP00_002999 [Monascus purpureus]
MGGNQATRVNPFVVNDRHVAIHITTRGSDWYWTVMSIMGCTTLTVICLSFFRPPSKRIFHYLLAAVAFIATIEHYSMASNLGWVPIDVEWRRSDDEVAGINRQIWWVRYIGWFLTWPLLSLSVLLTTAAPTVHIVWSLFLSAAMAVLALVGALVRSDYKWGYYAFWLWVWIMAVYALVWTPRKYARALGRDVQRVHFTISGWVSFLWMIYPICWGISEGGNVIPPDSEFIFYGILDCLLIPITSAAFLFLHRPIDPSHLGLYIRSYDDPIPGYRDAVASGGLPKDPEKDVPNGHDGPAETSPAPAAGTETV